MKRAWSLWISELSNVFTSLSRNEGSLRNSPGSKVSRSASVTPVTKRDVTWSMKPESVGLRMSSMDARSSSRFMSKISESEQVRMSGSDIIESTCIASNSAFLSATSAATFASSFERPTETVNVSSRLPSPSGRSTLRESSTDTSMRPAMTCVDSTFALTSLSSCT